MTNLFNYIDRPSPIHRLTGACKLVCLITWSLAAMTSFYTPLLCVLTAAALILFRVARLRLKDISFMVGIMLVYILMNNVQKHRQSRPVVKRQILPQEEKSASMHLSMTL